MQSCSTASYASSVGLLACQFTLVELESGEVQVCEEFAKVCKEPVNQKQLVMKADIRV
jgi:hypothetical protein